MVKGITFAKYIRECEKVARRQVLDIIAYGEGWEESKDYYLKLIKKLERRL